MSLLIKALDSAEKTKQAEKNKQADKYKKPGGSNAAANKADAKGGLDSQTDIQPSYHDELLSLELAPKEIAPDDASPTVTEQPSPELHAESELSITQTKATSELSLEEEAGLPPSLASKKYIKKPPAAKPSATTTTASADKKPESPAEAFAAAAAASTNAIASNPTPATSSNQAAASNNKVPSQLRPLTPEPAQKTAAKVFVANQAVRSPSSKYALLSLGVAGALIIWLGLQGYTYLKPLFAPNPVAIPPAPTSLEQRIVQDASQLTSATDVASETVIAEGANAENAVIAPPSTAANAPGVSELAANTSKAAAEIGAATTANRTEPAATSVLATAPSVQSAQAVANDESNINVTEAVPTKIARKTEATDATTQLRNQNMQLSSKVSAPTVDPALLAAYKAFNQGNDTAAQQQYRQVLQRDVRNVDALLGMAAIAQRQGRQADAAGWLQKVLEVDPKNAVAQSAMLDRQADTNAVSAESRLKVLVAQQPENANLHASLGNLYAEQEQWALAQDAYFSASRYAPQNPDYAFNLAISLDQLGKGDLALMQYQRALLLLNQSGASSPDRTQLETRIRALQP